MICVRSEVSLPLFEVRVGFEKANLILVSEEHVLFACCAAITPHCLEPLTGLLKLVAAVWARFSQDDAEERTRQ